MLRKILVFTGIILITAALLMGCASAAPELGPIGPAGPAGPQGPAGPPGDAASSRLEYVGSEKCGQCHEGEYAKFVLSGHPYNLTAINGAAPEFPYDDRTGGIDDPPAGYAWADISYVIGGFGWKALFVDQDGYVITGGEGEQSQWNYANEPANLPAGWAGYHTGEQVPTDCASCHSTGYQAEGHQGDRQGIVGTWAFEGVQCEACHGPGSLHAADPQGYLMQLDRSNQACAECHSRENPAHVETVDGFATQYTQYDQLYNSKHFALQCIACHDPHASSLHADEQINPDAGIRQVCESCHWQEAATQNGKRHTALVCTDCHMPPSGLSAQGQLDIFVGDLSAHLFSINPDPNAPQFNADGTLSMPYLTLPYACGHCHNNQVATVKPIELLAERAANYHTPPTATPAPEPLTTP